MGTLLEATLVGADARELRAALGTLFAEAERLDGLFTTWDAASETSRLNAAAGSGPRPVAPELSELLARSQALSRLTRGSFDVTVGPLVALWREAGHRGAPPSREAMAEALRGVGSSRLRVLGDGRAELAAGASVTLSGVAKGFALDRMLPLLHAAGVDAALLSFGQSSAWALGAPPGHAGWRLLARAPDGGFAGVLTLRDRALSVSGSLGQSVEIGGRRFGHVIDPRSGEPLESESLALVVAPDATLAEALSKALLVLGAGEGLDLVAAQPGCAALLLGPGGRTARTAGWDAAVAWEPLAPPAALKAPARATDPRAVVPDKSCPVCNADFPLRGDERAGEEVYCSYCGAPCRLTAPANDEACEVEEDF
jgi:thiamine biosynthesis lipoprotein